MSRFLKVMIVLLAIAAMAVPSVFAEDRLSLSGEMRVRGWYKDYDQDSTNSYIDQRLRIFGNIAVAEGVKIQFRTDVTERTWGSGGSEYGSGRMPQDGQQWDRAYLDLTKGDWHFRAGQQYAGYSLTQVVNSQDAGFKIDYKGPVTFSAFWLLDDNNGTASDSFLTAANIGHKTDSYKANVFAANQKKALSMAEDVYLFGADFTSNFGAFKLAVEADFFTGDASDTVDAVGTQLLVDLSTGVDAMTIGGQLMYAQGADSGEAQYTYLGNDFNGWDPLFDIGTSLSNEQIGLQRPFDFTGDDAGIVAARLYLLGKASDALGYGFSAAYAEPEEDANTSVDSAMLFAVAMKYALMANTSLQVQVQYTDIDDSDPNAIDSKLEAGAGLFVNF